MEAKPFPSVIPCGEERRDWVRPSCTCRGLDESSRCRRKSALADLPIVRVVRGCRIIYMCVSQHVGTITYSLSLFSAFSGEGIVCMCFVLSGMKTVLFFLDIKKKGGQTGRKSKMA